MGGVFENEQQRYKRFPANVATRFRRLDLSGVQKELKSLQAAVSAATNVGDLGVFIATQERLPMETVLEVIFCFEPQGREIKTLARVTWVCNDKDEKGMGVELIKVSQDVYATVVSRAKRGNWIEGDRKV